VYKELLSDMEHYDKVHHELADDTNARAASSAVIEDRDHSQP
jgi:hypothetical protein